MPEENESLLEEVKALLRNFELAIRSIPTARQSDARKEFYTVKLHYSRFCRKFSADSAGQTTPRASSPISIQTVKEASPDNAVPIDADEHIYEDVDSGSNYQPHATRPKLHPVNDPSQNECMGSFRT